MPALLPALLLGPLLRHVGETDASVWAEVDKPCRVTVRVRGEASPPNAGSSASFTVAGHHYALVLLANLPPGQTLEYTVELDDHQVWPERGSSYPPSRIRLVDPDRPFRLLFGSCRYATPSTVGDDRTLDADALDSYAEQMAGRPVDRWPDALLLLGDQVYADETSPSTQEFIRARRDTSVPPGTEVADFEEYTRLYHESWADPDVRWLLSTVPSSMIFDDHDVKDDWNTSHLWREEMQRTSWWEERITGALMSYWVYQHLGNLSPGALAEDPTWTRVQELAARGEDCQGYLREFAQAADREADGGKGAQWSYRRDWGRTRLLVVDSRCGRILAGQRSMLSEDEFSWVERQVEGGAYDHLLVGTSLPWLMPRALHDIESWDEALAGGSRGPWLAKRGESWRRAADLEHWAAFRESFDRLAALIGRVGRGQHGQPAPATVCVLSGDVHHAYVAQASYPEPLSARIYQLTCSPVHNEVQAYMHVGFRVGWSRAAEWLTTAIGRFAKVPPVPIRWHKMSGPYFGNEVATLTLDGRSARVALDRTGTAGPHGRAAPLERVASIPLAARRDSAGG